MVKLLGPSFLAKLGPGWAQMSTEAALVELAAMVAPNNILGFLTSSSDDDELAAICQPSARG